jgi:hypothetical protein
VKSTLWLRRFRVVLPAAAGAVLLAAGATAASPATAAAPATAPKTTAPPVSTLQSDPIRCWWKTDKTAVQVGERFVLTLTCSVIETSHVTVVPDLSQLEPGTVQLAPFEVLGGVRHADVKAGMWRYFQYEYTMRLIEDNFFRLDVDIPSLNIAYNVQMTEGATAQQGRDHKYVLRPLPIRINSLVPKDTTDIRDATHETFADVEARAARATNELVAAAICFGFAAVLFALAVVKAFARVRARLPAANRALPSGAVVRGCTKEMARVRSDVAHAGWTPETAARALAVLRIAGAVALSKPVAQATVAKSEIHHAGQLVLRKGWWRPKRVSVSAPVGAGSMAQRLAAQNGAPLEGRARTLLEELRDALTAFSAACYGRDIQLDPTTLDQALDQGSAALRQLRWFTLWPRWTAGALMKPITPLEDMAWSR